MASSGEDASVDLGSRRVNSSKKLYGQNGKSFVPVVEFGDKVQAKSMLVAGQNNNPAAARSVDQVSLYTRHDWKEAAVYRDDVENRATEQYSPGQRQAQINRQEFVRLHRIPASISNY